MKNAVVYNRFLSLRVVMWVRVFDLLTLTFKEGRIINVELGIFVDVGSSAIYMFP